ncbi:MAG TPA: hypothetical protein VM241_00385 [Candidatus Thermoplasmatota archaeon]|nr:hypothetical protein [Candidatus Thermoplasmatota archaeon]
MRSSFVLAVLVLALAPALAAAGGGEDGHSRRAGASSTDPAGDEQATLALGGAVDPLACHDPSIDILSVAATARRGTLRVEVQHAAPVRAPRLACGGLPAAAAGQAYTLAIGGTGDSFLFLSVKAAEACLYVLFQAPVQMSDCLPAAQVDGAAIRLEVGLRGSVAVPDGTRQYLLNGTLSIHAAAQEQGIPRPGPGAPLPNALLRVEDHSDTDAFLTVR